MTDRIESLLSQLTLQEKAALVAGADAWHSQPVARLGIPVLKCSDGPNGARGAGGSLGPTSACFPVGIALASTWNFDLVERVGAALGDETRSKGAQILLGPTINIQRTPLGGRNFECYSEDPFLTGRTATAYIRGLQSRGVGACVKHYVCNDAEFERFTMSSEVAERPLREIYLVPFEMAVRDAGTWSLMSAYNKTNGVTASENDYTLLKILKGEWGFDGLVISDWYGTYSERSLTSGLDLEMPGPARWFSPQAVLDAVASGALPAAALDDKVRRLLRTLERTGVFAAPAAQAEQALDRPEHRQVAREAATEAIVLLANDGMLPLDRQRVRTLAVIGENAYRPQPMGGGSSSVSPHYVVSPLEAIRRRAGDGLEIGYALGRIVHRSLPLPDPDWLVAPGGVPGKLAGEFFDNSDLSGAPAHAQLVRKPDLSWYGDDTPPNMSSGNFSARLSATLTVPRSARYVFGLASSGRARVLLDGAVRVDRWSEAAVAAGFEDRALVDLEGGRPYALAIEFVSTATSHVRLVRLGCDLDQTAEELEAEAVALAARADAAVVFAGRTNEWESEGDDQPDMSLPCAQADLIERIAAANPNTVVVLTTGSPVDLPWLGRVRAVVQTWFGGQECGNAIADVLFGDANPSGKLPQTFPARLADTPAYMNYPGECGKVYYGEGVFVGYRYYDLKDVAPLFPFGHGLSYTTFAYRRLALSADTYGPGDTVRVEVDVENTGARAGQEVVQLYVRDVQSSLARPPKELKAFAKVALAPGETKTVTFALDRRALAFYHPWRKGWVVEDGTFEVLAGSSSRDIRLTAEFAWAGEPGLDRRARLNVGTIVQAVMSDAQGRAVLERHLSEMLHRPNAQRIYSMSLEQVVALDPEFLSWEKLQAINADLAAIS